VKWKNWTFPFGFYLTTMSTSGIFELAKAGDANGLLLHIQDHIDDINKQDALGATPLIYAAWGGYMNIVCMLVNVGCSLDKQNRWGTTALHLAAELGRLDIVQVLVEAGANIYVRNEVEFYFCCLMITSLIRAFSHVYRKVTLL
jgi:ankyrin repeat protein